MASRTEPPRWAARIAATVGAAIALLATAPTAAHAVPTGSYVGSITLDGRSRTYPSTYYALDRIDVTAEQVVVHVRYHNGERETVDLTCPQDRSAALVLASVIGVHAQSVAATDNSCLAQLGATNTLDAGTDLALTGTFPAGDWADSEFRLVFFGATTGWLRLDHGQIQQRAADSSTTNSKKPWIWYFVCPAVAVFAVVLLPRLVRKRSGAGANHVHIGPDS